MTMNLITGKAGAPHITSSDQGAMQAGLVGNGNYLLQGGDGKFPAVTMQSANKALIPVLNLVIEGRYARVTAAETVTIESGVTGRNRNDLICVKYTRDSNNIETIALAVLKGTATSGTAARYAEAWHRSQVYLVMFVVRAIDVPFSFRLCAGRCVPEASCRIPSKCLRRLFPD